MQQKEALGPFVYDGGSSVYLLYQLDADIEFRTRDRDNVEYLIKMTRVLLISAHENSYLQVLNIIKKRALNALKLQLVGRDYFDPNASVSYKQLNTLIEVYFLFLLLKHLNFVIFCSTDPYSRI